MRRSSVLVVAIALAACGHAQKGGKHGPLSARDIIDDSSPAIVRIEAGDAKVGTGFILGADGLIATNLHVIEGESNIKVKLYKDPVEYTATVIAGLDKGHDLALLRIKPKAKLPTLHLGDSSAVSAGDRVYAIGNPLGVFDYSITDGLISQVRPLSADLTILQISAAISQGSSGGPLFNQFGEVIGVTTAIITQGQAINLAVPANYLRPMMKEQIALSTVDFAKETKEAPQAGSPDTEDSAPVVRQIPEHPVTIWKGCSEKDMEEVLRSISDAIAIGAPLYNRNTPEGYEACYRVYEGTSLRYTRSADSSSKRDEGANSGGGAPCEGVRKAFDDGITRAKTMASYKQKAWALRDTFDGLINAFGRWCEQDKDCMAKFGKQSQQQQHP